jgi:RNA polymerase sigma-70 factor (ECF subfamily)
LRVVKVAASGLLSNGRAYLYRVAHNLIADHYRQRQRRREDPLDEAPLTTLADPAPLPEQRLLDLEQLRHLDAIIAALPPRSRQVFLLARVEQMALADIGRQLGISRQTVHGHLLRALVALQQVPGA